MLAFVFMAGPVYASPPPQRDTVIDAGGNPIPYTVEGTIVDRSTGIGVSGMAVY